MHLLGLGTEPVRTASSTSSGSILKLVNGLASTPVHQYLRRSPHTPQKPAETHMFRLPQRTQRDTQPHSTPHTTTQRWRPYDHAQICLPWQLAICCRPRQRCWWFRGCCVAAATPGGSAEHQQQPAAPAAHGADDVLSGKVLAKRIAIQMKMIVVLVQAAVICARCSFRLGSFGTVVVSL